MGRGEEDEEIVAALHVEVVMAYGSGPAELRGIWVRTQCTVRGGETGSFRGLTQVLRHQGVATGDSCS